MNYKLLFEMECEKHRQTEAKLKRVLRDIMHHDIQLVRRDKYIESLSKDIEELKALIDLMQDRRCEVQPKLQQRIITEIYC